jgi:hypothetical protein
VLDASYAARCRSLRLDCAVTGQAVLARAMAAVTTPLRADGRSAPVTAADIALAVTGASYDLASNERWLWAALARLPRASGDDVIGFGRLADQLTQRSDGGRISTRMVAYVDTMCRAYGGWAGGRAPGRAAPALLGVLGRTCRELGHPGGGWPVPAHRAGRGCVLVNDGDPVTPAAWGRAWASALPDLTVGRYRYRGHASPRRAVGLAAAGAACLRAFAPR